MSLVNAPRFLHGSRAELELKRRNNDLDSGLVRETIRREMDGAGELAGYRYIWHALRLRYRMHVPGAQARRGPWKKR